MKKRHWQGLIHRWRRYLPVSAGTPVITLHEGSTDLVPQFLKFARQAIACATRLSLVAACRGEAVRPILSGT